MHCKQGGLVVHFPSPGCGWHVVSQALFYFFFPCQIL